MYTFVIVVRSPNTNIENYILKCMLYFITLSMKLFLFFYSIAAVKMNLIESELTVTTPSNLSAGLYNITCLFGDTSVIASEKLTVLNFDNINITSISPKITKVNTNVDLTLTGTGFVNTSDLACLYGRDHKNLKVTFVSNTKIHCILPTSFTAKTMETYVYLSFIPYHRSNNKFLVSVKHYIGDDVPSMISATFTHSLSGVDINFDSAGKLESSVTCADLFPYNHTSFGNEPICKFSSKILRIRMKGNSNLTLGILVLNARKIQARGVETIYSQDEQSVNLERPVKSSKPEVWISGSQSVGK